MSALLIVFFLFTERERKTKTKTTTITSIYTSVCSVKKASQQQQQNWIEWKIERDVKIESAKIKKWCCCFFFKYVNGWKWNPKKSIKIYNGDRGRARAAVDIIVARSTTYNNEESNEMNQTWRISAAYVLVVVALSVCINPKKENGIEDEKDVK